MIRLTPGRVEILYRLFSQKIEPGTIQDIAKILDGVNIKSDTYSFLQLLIKTNTQCITRYTGSDKRLGIIDGEKEVNNKKYSTFQINKKAVALLWKTTPEFKLSKEIMRDESMLIDMFG